jgi:hypothetical protein
MEFEPLMCIDDWHRPDLPGPALTSSATVNIHRTARRMQSRILAIRHALDQPRCILFFVPKPDRRPFFTGDAICAGFCQLQLS